MSKDFLPHKDLELQSWLAHFIDAAENNLAALGISQADFVPLQAYGAAFAQNLTDVETARLAAKTAVVNKDVSRDDCVAEARALVKQIQALRNLPASVKANLGISAGDGKPVHTPPVTPTHVVAEPQASGVNILKWQRAGNKPATQYVVQYKSLSSPAAADVSSAAADVSSGWLMAGHTTKSVFYHKNRTPGVPLAYRIVAARADLASPPTLPVLVYVE